MSKNFLQQYRDLLLIAAGILLSGSAVCWWGLRYRHHPPRLLVTTDGYGGSPSVCYIPAKRGQACILLPGSTYAAGLMIRTLQQNGENNIRTIFSPSSSEQLRGLNQFFQKMPPGQIIMMPAKGGRTSWRNWLSLAPFHGIFIQTAPASVHGWKLNYGTTEYKEPRWQYQTGDLTFRIFRPRSGVLELQADNQNKSILRATAERSSRPQIIEYLLISSDRSSR